jgi:hypothetical protein
MSYPLFNKERKKVAKKERNNYYCYYFSSLTLYEPIYQHIFSLILSVTFYYDATRGFVIFLSVRYLYRVNKRPIRLMKSPARAINVMGNSQEGSDQIGVAMFAEATCIRT